MLSISRTPRPDINSNIKHSSGRYPHKLPLCMLLLKVQSAEDASYR